MTQSLVCIQLSSLLCISANVVLLDALKQRSKLSVEPQSKDSEAPSQQRKVHLFISLVNTTYPGISFATGDGLLCSIRADVFHLRSCHHLPLPPIRRRQSGVLHPIHHLGQHPRLEQPIDCSGTQPQPPTIELVRLSAVVGTPGERRLAGRATVPKRRFDVKRVQS